MNNSYPKTEAVLNDNTSDRFAAQFCSNCGSKFSSGDIFCSTCGFKID
ncbi:MAG: zinc ribbon domain-containing protein [Candidatus Hodarchaeales archaeon]